MTGKNLREQLSKEAKELSSLVEYQKDSIVSKTLIESNAGGVTLFAFDTGQGLKEHTAPFEAIVYIFEGKAEASIGSTNHIVKQGEVILFPANIPHAIKALEKFKMMLIMIK